MKQKALFLMLCISFIAITLQSDSKKELVTDITKAPLYGNEAGAEEHMLVTKDLTGDPGFYMGHARFQPGAIVPEHVHKTEMEAVYVISGNAKMTIGKQTYEIGPGFAIYVPPDTPHSLTNDGKVPVEVIHMYAPGGPEERFKLWKRK